MDSENSGAISVYAEAKGEYTKQLCVFLNTPLQKFFLGLLDIARAEEPEKKKVLKKYQDLLSQIPDWNMDKVGRETGKIQEDCRCDYLEELLTAVFIAHTKVLSAIRLSSKNKSIQITVPKLEHFLHRTLSESARRIWSNVYLFADDIPSLEKQKNLRQLEVILDDCVQQAVRGLLPVKNLLRDYLAEPEPEEEEVAKEDTKPEEVVPEEVKVEEVKVEEVKVEEVVEVKPEEVKVDEAKPEEVKVEEPVAEPVTTVAEPVTTVATVAEPVVEPVVTVAEPVTTPSDPVTIVVDTEPRVHFSEFDTVFKDGKTEIVPSIGDENDEIFNESLRIYDETSQLSSDDFESLDNRAASPIAFEEL